jgi:hypothetical protein
MECSTELILQIQIRSDSDLRRFSPIRKTLATDGYGKSWIVDLTRESTSFGPIFYACHDAPVIVYQTDSLLHFVEEVVVSGNKPWKSEIVDVHETFTTRI